jgi:hypothetical protein
MISKRKGDADITKNIRSNLTRPIQIKFYQSVLCIIHYVLPKQFYTWHHIVASLSIRSSFSALEQFSLGIVVVAVVTHVRATQVLAGAHATIGRQPHQFA